MKTWYLFEMAHGDEWITPLSATTKEGAVSEAIDKFEKLSRSDQKDRRILYIGLMDPRELEWDYDGDYHDPEDCVDVLKIIRTEQEKRNHELEGVFDEFEKYWK